MHLALFKRVCRDAQLTQARAAFSTALRSTIIPSYEHGTINPTKANLETLAPLYGRPAWWCTPQERPAGLRIQRSKPAEASAAEALFEDDVTEAYCLAQPNLTNETVRPIAD